MHAQLSLPGGARIVVPDSLELIAPYVLREQGDWFRDEIRVVRKVVAARAAARAEGARA